MRDRGERQRGYDRQCHKWQQWLSRQLLADGRDHERTGGGPYAFSPGYGITTIASTATSLISSNLLIRDGNDMGFNVASGSAGGRVDLLVSGNVSELYGVCGVIKTGAGVMLLTGTANVYSGGTTINAGTLQVGDGTTSNGSLPGGVIDNVNGTLAFANPSAMTYTGVISGSGALAKLGAARLRLPITTPMAAEPRSTAARSCSTLAEARARSSAR